MTARFRVVGRLDAARTVAGTVAIDRAAGTFTVRAHRRRKAYTLPLATVADIVVSVSVKAEVAARRREKAARRAGRAE